MDKSSTPKENTLQNKKLSIIPIIALLAVYGVVLIRIAFRNTIWYDEAFGLVAIRHSLSEMINLLALDVHPPLYYIILKEMSIFGPYAYLAYRLVSVIPLLAGLSVTALWLNKKYSYMAAMIYLFVMMASPQVLHFGVEMRMYGLAFFFVSMTMIACMNLMEEETTQGFAFVTIFATLSAYTHYFAGAGVVGICMSTFVVMMIRSKRRRKTFFKWLMSVGTMVICYSPWLVVFAKQSMTVKNNFWLSEYTMTIAKDTVKFFFDEKTLIPSILLIVLLLAAIANIIKMIIKKEKEFIPECVLAFSIAFPIVLGLGVSALIRPVFQAKYAFPVYGLWGVFLALSLSSLRIKWQKIVVILASAVVLGMSILPSAYTELACSDDPNAGEMIALMDTKPYKNLPVVHCNPQLMGCFAAYFPENTQYIRADILANEFFPEWESLANIKAFESDEELKKSPCIYVLTSYDQELYEQVSSTMELIGTYRLSTYSGFDLYLFYNAGEPIPD